MDDYSKNFDAIAFADLILKKTKEEPDSEFSKLIHLLTLNKGKITFKGMLISMDITSYYKVIFSDFAKQYNLKFPLTTFKEIVSFMFTIFTLEKIRNRTLYNELVNTDSIDFFNEKGNIVYESLLALDFPSTLKFVEIRDYININFKKDYLIRDQDIVFVLNSCGYEKKRRRIKNSINKKETVWIKNTSSIEGNELF